MGTQQTLLRPEDSKKKQRIQQSNRGSQLYSHTNTCKSNIISEIVTSQLSDGELGWAWVTCGLVRQVGHLFSSVLGHVLLKSIRAVKIEISASSAR